jgi:hypothetical protein
MAIARKVRKPMTEKQMNYIHSLAAERGLRWANPPDPAYTSTAEASFLINELLYRFSLRLGLFSRDYIQTGEFEVVDEAKALSY